MANMRMTTCHQVFSARLPHRVRHYLRIHVVVGTRWRRNWSLLSLLEADACANKVDQTMSPIRIPTHRTPMIFQNTRILLLVEHTCTQSCAHNVRNSDLRAFMTLRVLSLFPVKISKCAHSISSCIVHVLHQVHRVGCHPVLSLGLALEVIHLVHHPRHSITRQHQHPSLFHTVEACHSSLHRL